MAKRTNDEFVAAFLGMSPEEINEGLIQGRWKSNRGKSVARQVLAGELDPAKAKARLNQEAKDEAKALKKLEAREAAETEAPKPVLELVSHTPTKNSKPAEKGDKPKPSTSKNKSDKDKK